MSATEQSERTVLPLARAAARLGITPDALRMRIRRGKAAGFKRGGRIFVYLAEAPEPGAAAPGRPGEQTWSAPAGSTEHWPNTAGAFRFRGEADARDGRSKSAAQPESDPVTVIVEFQKVELTRLLKENDRMNERLDQSLNEMRHLREMLQREQVLRQHEQTLRQQMQHLLDHLTARFALPRPEPEVVEHAQAAGPGHGGAAPDASTGGPGVAGGETAAPAHAPGALADSSAADVRAARPSGAAQTEIAGTAPPPAVPPDTGSAPEPAAEAGHGAPTVHPEATELAEILKELGQSLREVESAMPDSPGRAHAPREATGPRGAGLEPAVPSETERREAARVMKKIFRNRTAPRDREA